MLTESLNVIYYHALFTFLDRPKQSSLLSSAKSRRHLVPSRNKALINLMMSLLLVVLILGRRRNSYSLPQRKRALPHKKQEELHRKKKKIFSYGRAHS